MADANASGYIRPSAARQIRSIIDEVAKATAIPAEEITGARRDAPIFRARRLVVGIARRHTRATLTEIGTVLRRDHTSILNAERRFGMLFDAADQPIVARAGRAGNLLVGLKP